MWHSQQRAQIKFFQTTRDSLLRWLVLFMRRDLQNADTGKITSTRGQ